MKRALRLAGSCVLLGAALSAVRGDDAPAKAPKVPPAVSPTTGTAIPASSEALQTPMPTAIVAPAPAPDVDNIDFSTTDPEELARQTLQVRQENKDQPDFDAEAWQERQREVKAEHDWMLRSYREQLRKNGLDKTGITDADERAALDGYARASDDPLLPAAPAPKSKPREPAPPESENDKSLSGSLAPFSVQPMLPPLASNRSTGATSEEAGGDLRVDSNYPLSATAPAIPTQPGDSSLLDIPGMTAAEEGMPPTDLNLEDRLPGEPPTTVRPHPDANNFAPPTLPLNDTDAFYKKQAASLQAPNAPTFRALVTPPVIPYKQPVPTAKPVINGLRTHIDDPFDILNRPHGE